jgi:hypothetical protein
MPNTSLPPEMMSTVAAILASTAGGRSRLLVTITPRRSRSVWAASAASSVHASRAAPLTDGVRLAPDPEDVVVAEVHLARLDAETQPLAVTDRSHVPPRRAAGRGGLATGPPPAETISAYEHQQD